MKHLSYRIALIFAIMGLSCASAFAQQVKGTVTDTSGEPVIGAGVIVEGTTIGTTVDIDGTFVITGAVPSDAVLVVSSIGYKTVRVPVGGGSLDIILEEDTEMLEETVVVGYGVQKKSVVTASISRVDGDDLNVVKASSINDALKGKVSGVQITQTSGQPGAGSAIKIRGVGTVNSSDPLYIVDGMPVDGGIDYLSPTDIQSVEILKDAASAAIYGARAANGVVLVTTRGGKKGQATVTYNGSYGFQNPWKKKEVLNASEYMIIMNEARVNDGGTPLYTMDEIAKAGKGTDWQDEVFNYNAPVQQHQVSVSGGSDKAQYFLSFGAYDQEGIVGGNYGKSNYKRYSIRSNNTYVPYEVTDRNFLNKITLTANVGYSRIVSSSIEANTEYGSVLGSALAFNPNIPVFADDATAAQILADHPTAIVSKDGKVYSLPPSGYQELSNPVAALATNEGSVGNSDKFVATFSGEVNVLPGLTFKSSFGTDLSFWGSDGYTFPYYRSAMRYAENSSVWSSMNRGYRWQVENVLSYHESFGRHNISAVLGQSAMSYQYRYLSGNDYTLLETDPLKANIDSAIGDREEERVSGGTGGNDYTRLASYFARFDYNYDERYMLELTIRRDGSSHFGPQNKWAVFPAASLGWNISNEPFFRDLGQNVVNLLKLRASWGKNGNEAIGNFRYASLMDGGQNYYYGGGYDQATASKTGSMQYGASPGALANPTISWEESEQLDLGLDARLFNDRLSFGFDYFKKDTHGMLQTQPIPSYVGQSAPMANLGEMTNWGLEFELGWSHQVGDFHYSINGNATFLRNKLINLGNASGETVYESAGASGVGDFIKGQNGEVWPYFYGYKTDGIFQNWGEVNSYVNDKGELLQPAAQPGDVRFVDYNKDGSINDSDRTKIGKGMADWTYGLTFAAEYKGFDFNVFFQGSLGNDIYDFSIRGDIPAMNRPAWILDRWIGEGTSNRLPRMTNANPNTNWRSSDLYIKDGSYMRVKTAQLGYTIPANLLKRMHISNLRVFVAAENLFTFTKYDGFDPEIASNGYYYTGVDKGCYPQARTITLGATITL